MADKKEIKVAPLLSTNKIESVIDRPIESMGMTNFGELFAEVITSPKGKKQYLNRYVHQIGGDSDKCIPINYPPLSIEPDMMYPYRELRMSQSRFNELDYVNIDGWVKEPFRDSNGSLIRDVGGNAISMLFWCKLKIMTLPEKDECSYGNTQYILGSDITKYNEAKQIVGSSLGNSVRQRVEDENEVVSVQ